MNKTITTWLAGLALMCAMGAALPLPASAQDAPKPDTAAAVVAPVDAPATTAVTPAPASASVATPAPAAAPAPVPQKGDTTWMFIATVLVILMTIPGLALFYGGLVRTKNMLSVLMQVFVVFALIIVLWCIYGYSVAFTPGNAVIGGFDRALLTGIWDPAKGAFAYAATFSKGVVIPEFIYVAFQGTFAAITCCLIVGAFAERIKFAAVLAFMVLWFTFGYLPIAHMVWFWTGPDAITDAATLATETADRKSVV